jgi:thiol:disulfide interchange protein DsbC
VNKPPLRAVLGILTLLLAAPVLAAPPQAVPAAADPRVELAAKLPGVTAEELRPSPIAGLYELARGTEITYVSADGRYILTGDLYQIAKDAEFPNLSDQRRRELRAKLLAGIPDTQMVVFAPNAPKYTVTVFTDPDCTWCRKLHSQIAEYNKLGIKIRYAFFPREGPDSEAWHKSEAVWCSVDRRAALTRAKLGETVTAKACANTPVRHTWEVGKELGIEGTPGLMLADGELIPGYLPPKDLLKRLVQAAAGKPPAKS